MAPRRVYYVTYMDPRTGFLKREEFDSHHDQDVRIAELRKAGVIQMTTGSFEA